MAFFSRLLKYLQILTISVLFFGLLLAGITGRRWAPIFSTMDSFAHGRELFEFPAIHRVYVEDAEGHRVEFIPKLQWPYDRWFLSQFLWNARKNQPRLSRLVNFIMPQIHSRFSGAKRLIFTLQWLRPKARRHVVSIDDLDVVREEVLIETVLPQ